MVEINSKDINTFDRVETPEVPLYPQVDSFLLGVQGGITKLIPTDLFYYRHEEVDSAKSLNGEEPDNFLKNDDEIDATTLGGKNAEDFVTAEQIENLVVGDYEWAIPRMWFREDIMPDGNEPYNKTKDANKSGWIILNGMELNPHGDGADLFGILDYSFTYDKDESTVLFRVPNFQGRVPIGVGGESALNNYQSVTKKENFPQSIGEVGGDSVGKLENVLQIPQHGHPISSNSNYNYVLASTNDGTEPSSNAGSSDGTMYEGREVIAIRTTGTNGSVNPYPFSVLNPCLGVIWIMRLKNPNKK